ncbi:MAG: diguanylate cyclase [Thermoanaerobaculia bacterium]
MSLVRTLLAILLLAPTVLAQLRTAQSLVEEGERLESEGKLDDAARLYAEAIAQAEKGNDREMLARALLSSGYLHYFRGEMNQALVDLRRAYDVSVAVRSDQGRRAALACIAHIYADPSIAQYDRAIEYYRQVLAEYAKSKLSTNTADTYFNLGSTYERKGDLTQALDWYRRALRAEELLGRKDEAAYVKRSIGITLGKLGRGAEALPLLNEALRHFIEVKDPERAEHVRQSRGVIHRRLGNYGKAIADLEPTRVYFEKTKNERFLEKSQDELALAYAGAGRWPDAYRMRTANAELQRRLAEKLREEHTSRLRVQFDAEKKEQENHALIEKSAADARIRGLQNVILVLGGAIIAVLIYLAFRSVRDARRMRTMAMTDELTRLPNRRSLFALADAELQRARTLDQPLTVAALDIDFFKRINDRYGHAAGDTVLRRVSQACRTALRGSDAIGRTGGEEFIALLPATRERDALAIAERLRAAVEAIDLSDIAPELRATISVGLAEWAGAEESMEKLIARADELLYAAKQSGRNRVQMASAS